jgi:hypothetical protein
VEIQALGDPATVNLLHFLYWGTDPNREVAVQALWQRQEFAKWPRQNFVPDPSKADPKQQIVDALETPAPNRRAFCISSVIAASRMEAIRYSSSVRRPKLRISSKQPRSA